MPPLRSMGNERRKHRCASETADKNYRVGGLDGQSLCGGSFFIMDPLLPPLPAFTLRLRVFAGRGKDKPRPFPVGYLRGAQRGGYTPSVKKSSVHIPFSRGRVTGPRGHGGSSAFRSGRLDHTDRSHAARVSPPCRSYEATKVTKEAVTSRGSLHPVGKGLQTTSAPARKSAKHGFAAKLLRCGSLARGALCMPTGAELHSRGAFPRRGNEKGGGGRKNV